MTPKQQLQAMARLEEMTSADIQRGAQAAASNDWLMGRLAKELLSLQHQISYTLVSDNHRQAEMLAHRMQAIEWLTSEISRLKHEPEEIGEVV